MERLRACLVRAELAFGAPGHGGAVAELLAAADSVPEVIAKNPDLRARIDQQFMAEDLPPGEFPPLMANAHQLVADAERFISGGDPDELLRTIQALRLMEDAVGLPAMFGSDSDWLDRLDAVTFVFKDWRAARFTWNPGDVQFVPPDDSDAFDPVREATTEGLRANAAVGDPEAAAELRRRGVA